MREAERALRESEERFRFLFEDNPTMYFIVDAEGTIVSVNRYGAAHLGYTVQELTGHPLLKVVHDADRETVRGHLAECMRSPGQVCRWEFRKVRKDGSVLWVRELARPMRNAEGGLVILIVCDDVTEAKRAEATRRFLSEASRALASSLDYQETLTRVARLAVPAVADWCVIHVVEADGMIHRVEVAHRDPEKEARARATREYPRHPVGEGVVPAVIHTGEPELVPEVSREWLERAAGTEEGLFGLVREMGTRSVIIVPLRARGRTLGAITLIAGESGRRYDRRDLARAEDLADRAALAVDNAALYREARTARTEAERRAREERGLREAVGAVAATFTTDAVIRQIATSAVDAIGADGAFVSWIHTERDEVEVVALAGDIPPPATALVAYADTYTRKVTERRRPLVIHRLTELEGPLRAGPLASACPECSALVAPLSSGEQPIGALFLLRKPERPIFSPEEITRAHTFGELAGLAFRKLQLLEESQRRRDELERITESRARLMRGFSHDVKNPLGAADGYAEVLEDGIMGELTETQRDGVRRIHRSIQTALRLIDNLLELARAEAGQIEVERVRTDVAEATREVAEDFRAQATAAGLALEVRAPRTAITETDPTRVRQILGNLLSNAVKYTREGRITVAVDLRGDGEGLRPGDWIAVGVTDTGPGIPEEKHEQIFEEFARVEADARRGAGIGLASSRRIARLLDGDITLRSEVGRGSTFTLWLPRSGVRRDGSP